MTQVTVDDEVAAKLRQSGDIIEFVDRHGNSLGHLDDDPKTDRLIAGMSQAANALSEAGDINGAVALYDQAIGIYERLVIREGREELADGLTCLYLNKAKIRKIPSPFTREEMEEHRKQTGGTSLAEVLAKLRGGR